MERAQDDACLNIVGERVRDMKRLVAICLVTAGLSACGADGEPVQPTLNAGISVGTGGVHVGGGVGLNSGPVSILLGF